MRSYEDIKGWPAGINVEIKGPSGIIKTVTDQFGIFDMKGLPPGLYEVRPELDEQLYQSPGCGPSAKLENGAVWECKLQISSTGKRK